MDSTILCCCLNKSSKSLGKLPFFTPKKIFVVLSVPSIGIMGMGVVLAFHPRNAECVMSEGPCASGYYGYKVGPLPVTSRVITYNPYEWPSKWVSGGYNLYKWSCNPTCNR